MPSYNASLLALCSARGLAKWHSVWRTRVRVPPRNSFHEGEGWGESAVPLVVPQSCLLPTSPSLLTCLSTDWEVTGHRRVPATDGRVGGGPQAVSWVAYYYDFCPFNSLTFAGSVILNLASWPWPNANTWRSQLWAFGWDIPFLQFFPLLLLNMYIHVWCPFLCISFIFHFILFVSYFLFALVYILRCSNNCFLPILLFPRHKLPLYLPSIPSSFSSSPYAHYSLQTRFPPKPVSRF